MAQRGRIGYLDIFRYLTVTLAIISHIVGHHNLYDEHATQFGAIAKSVTRAASPALLVLFGVMLELVYVRRYKASIREASVSLLHRSFLCYLAVVAISTLYLISGKVDLVRYAGSVIFVAPVANNDIFKIYAILLVLMIPFLWLRLRFGVVGVACLALLLWAIHWLALKELPAMPYPLQHLGSLIFGVGQEFGPTILHSFVLIAFGMAITHLLERSDDRPSWLVLAAVLLAFSMAVLTYYVNSEGVFGVARKLAFMEEWRNQHHIGYYSYGIVVSCALIATAYLLSLILPQRLQSYLAAVGGSTLMYFFLGNLLIFLMPDYRPTEPLTAIGIILAYILILTFVTYEWARSAKKAGPVVRSNAFIKDVIRSLLDINLSFPKRTPKAIEETTSAE